MTDISHPITRTRKTDIAGSVKVTPSGGSTGTPIVAADLVNGFTAIVVNFAANETVKNAVFAVADDAAVEGTETYRLTLSDPQPSGTLSTSFVEGTLADNDSAPPDGGSATVFGPETTGDTGSRDVAGANQRMEHPYLNGRVAGTYMLGLDANGNGIALHQQTDTIYHLRIVTAYSVDDPNDSDSSTILSGSRLNINFANDDILAVDIRSGNIQVYRNGSPLYSITPNGYNVSAYVRGNFARYLKFAGSTVTNLKIIRL